MLFTGRVRSRLHFELLILDQTNVEFVLDIGTFLLRRR